MEGGSSTAALITLLLCMHTFSVPVNSIVAAVDIIRASQRLEDGSTIVSAAGHFELGFISPGMSKSRYVGIWYKKVSKKKIVWIANRETPLNTTSSVLQLSSNGNLVILNASDHVVWSSNSSTSVKKPVMQLLDSGNLVVRDETDSAPENYIWQSFDILGNAHLPGGKLGWNLETGLERYISSWKSEDDPSPGLYKLHIDRNGFPQLILRKGPAIQFRAGPWNGVRFSGTPDPKPDPLYTGGFVSNDKELYLHYELHNNSVYSVVVLNPLSYIQRWTWTEKSQIWQLYPDPQGDYCDRYASCGAYGSCNPGNSPMCQCLEGFEPKDKKEWDVADWSSGCVRKVQLSCTDGEGFVLHPGLKLPDTQRSWFDTNMSLDECRRVCLKNCSCTAYANTDIRGSGSGCLLWFEELIDIKELNENGQDLYVRKARFEYAASVSSAKMKRLEVKYIVIPSLLIATMMLGVCLWVIWKKMQPTKEITRLNPKNDNIDEDIELPLFDFATLANATNGFSTNSKLGEGGFGTVYKGILEGKEIAVKRLSKDSKQGQKEFKNEVSCIAQLKHRNLVKLLGCSVQEGERMLVYEYMPNKSLDSYIFDEKQRKTLDWPMRYNIINGIARGLLYLHQDSRLRIIHRDLKASNVLLDREMNPKISDFGTARICGETDAGANTTRVVGTYGYMSPEYAADGMFSVKSDVYSFGVLLLEIVGGKRNKNFTHPDHKFNLLGHVWKIYMDGDLSELVDEVIAQSCQEYQIEVFRAIQIGLLCVQQYPADRPSMATVVLMLTSEIPLPQPKEPGFFIERRLCQGNPSSYSSNYLSCTTLVPR